VREQLESIAAQTLPPAELVVCDDGSTDGTIAAIEAFAASAAIPVRLHRNEARLGAARNFMQAIALCEGDLIALADQDDVWLPQKVERLQAAMRGGVAYAFCDASIIDEQGRPAGKRTLLEGRFSLTTIASKYEKQREVELMMKRDFIYGTTLMLHARVRDILLPIPDGWSHDTWTVNVLACLGYRGAPVLEPLVRYRQHGVQASGGLTDPKPVRYPDRVEALEELWAHVVAKGGELNRPPSQAVLAIIEEKLRYLNALVRMEVEPFYIRPLYAAREIASGRWSRYSPRRIAIAKRRS
jgi:glycosyltransferase involved in cell wall biosynthesis